MHQHSFNQFTNTKHLKKALTLKPAVDKKVTEVELDE